MENNKMRHARVLVGFTVIFIFLWLPLLGAAASETMAEKLERLSTLVEKNKQADPQKALEAGNQALEILQDFPDDKIKLKVLYGMCWASGLLGNYREALDRGKEAETLALQVDDKKELTRVFNSLANIYLYLSDFNKALDYALQAKAISESLGYKRGIASALVSIARVHRHLDEYEKALATYEQAMKISEQLGNRGNVARILNNIATVHWKSKLYQKALDVYSHSLKIMKEVGRDIGIAQVMRNIGCVYSETRKYKQALQYDKQSLKLLEKIGDKGQIAYALGSIGKNYRHLQKYDTALDYMDRSLKMALELGSKDLLQLLYKEYTHIYEAMADYKNAFLYHKKFKDVNDQILNEDRNRQIAHLEVVYEVEKKEKEYQLLKKDNQVQIWMRNFLIVVSVLVLIIALVTYYRYRIRKKTEKVLRASEQKLKKMNAAKDKLFTIIAHDLGSPLNSLLLSSAHLKDHSRALDQQDLEEFIHNIYNQTRDMADLLANLLQWAMVQIGKIQQDRETVDMRLLTEETAAQIKYAAQKKKIRLAAHIMENTMAWADKRMMQVVIRNLLSNAVKYTHPGGEINITSKDTGSHIEITVSDNGVGMDGEKAERLFKEEFHESTRGTSNEKGTGLGLVLCKEFVEKNDGEIRVQSQPLLGSHFSFTLPKQN
jgi:signal transduction histidine kinase